jgi:hypothetical protein
MPQGLSQKSPGAKEALAETRGDHQGIPCLCCQTGQESQSQGGDTLTGLVVERIVDGLGCSAQAHAAIVHPNPSWQAALSPLP